MKGKHIAWGAALLAVLYGIAYGISLATGCVPCQDFLAGQKDHLQPIIVADASSTVPAAQ